MPKVSEKLKIAEWGLNQDPRNYPCMLEAGTRSNGRGEALCIFQKHSVEFLYIVMHMSVI